MREDAEVVHFHLGPGNRHVVGAEQRLVGEQACVVDDQVHVAAITRRLRNLGVVSHVQFECNAAARKLFDQMRCRRRIATARVHLAGAGLQQYTHEGFADASISARDEANTTIDFHSSALRVR
jgi:hypothetical protein